MNRQPVRATLAGKPCVMSVCFGWLYAAVAFGAFAQGQMPTVSLSAGIHIIRAEVAANNENRMRGLMFRKSLAPNQGMLFIFEDTSRHCMWMKNTLIPLSVAFIASDGTIVNIADMKPHDETSHCAAKPVPFALEMDRGWFAGRGIKPGSKISGLEKASVAR